MRRYDRQVRVKGDAATIWRELQNVLVNLGYSIRTSIENSHITAERGSKIISSVAGSSKGSWRQVDINFQSIGNEHIVTFNFTFSYWSAGIVWGDTIKEINQMVDAFERKVSSIYQPQQIPSKDRVCVKCKRNIPFDANICPYCGHDYR